MFVLSFTTVRQYNCNCIIIDHEACVLLSHPHASWTRLEHKLNHQLVVQLAGQNCSGIVMPILNTHADSVQINYIAFAQRKFVFINFK